MSFNKRVQPPTLSVLKTLLSTDYNNAVYHLNDAIVLRTAFHVYYDFLENVFEKYDRFYQISSLWNVFTAYSWRSRRSLHLTTWSTWVIYISGSAGMVVDRKIYTFMYDTSPQLKKVCNVFFSVKKNSFFPLQRILRRNYGNN